MRKTIVVLVSSVLLMMSGCTTIFNDFKNVNKNEVKIGVIETTETRNKSKIHWYDKQLNKIAEQKLKYATLGDSFGNGIYEGDEIFLFPQGLMKRKDAKKVISINKNDFTITEYPVPNISLNDIAVDKDYIYTINTLDFVTHLSRVKMDDHEFNEKLFSEEYFTGLTTAGNKIFAFADTSDDVSTQSMLYIFNQALEILEEIDISKYGVNVHKFLLDDNILYVGITSTLDDSPSRFVLKINIESYEIEVIDTGHDFPNDLIDYEDSILITHNDMVMGEGSVVSVLEKENYAMRHYDLNTKLQYSNRIEDHFFTLDQEKLSMFDIKDDYKLIKDQQIEIADYSYISGIIIIE